MTAAHQSPCRRRCSAPSIDDCCSLLVATHEFSQCGLRHGRACYLTKTTFLQFWCFRCCLFLDQILPRWQDTICMYGLVLVSCDFMLCRCTQGSVLGLLLFSAYTSPLSTIAKSHQVFQQQYADDTQLYVALSPINYSNELITLQSCLSSLHVWFCENGMALNPSKSDAILFGTAQRLKTMSSLASVKIVDSAIQFSDTIKILGVTLDSTLTL